MGLGAVRPVDAIGGYGGTVGIDGAGPTLMGLWNGALHVSGMIGGMCVCWSLGTEVEPLKLFDNIVHCRTGEICMCWSMGGEVEPLKLFDNIAHCRIRGTCVY